MKISEVKSINFPPQLLELWNHAGIDELTDVQAKAFGHMPLVTGQNNAVVIGPTSSGKTFIGEALGVTRAQKLDRVIYLVPYKALASEKYLLFGRVPRRRAGNL